MSVPKDPQHVVGRYFEHLVAERWGEASRLLDPIFLRHFRESDARRAWPVQRISVETYLERDPDLPREVAEYWVRQQALHPPASIADYFAGIGSEEELADLDDVELFARHLEAVDPNARYRRHLAALARQHPEFKEQLNAMMQEGRSIWRFDVVGSIVARERTFVLYEHPGMRDGAVPGYEPIPHVAVVIDRGDGWRIAHDPSPFSGMAVSYPPVTVLDSNGDTVELRLRRSESA